MNEHSNNEHEQKKPLLVQKYNDEGVKVFVENAGDSILSAPRDVKSLGPNAYNINSLGGDESPSNPIVLKEAKPPKKPKKTTTTGKAKRTFGDIIKFMIPTLWPKGEWGIRFLLIISLLLLLLYKVLVVAAPYVLKMGIDRLEESKEDITYYILAYVGIRFLGDFMNQLKDLTFATVSASAEVYIAHTVFNHVQNQSLSFHLKRETGKVIRVVSRGSQSFSNILRIALFNIFPIGIETVLVLVVLGISYPYYIMLATMGSVILYLVVTVVATEWRAKYFKKMNDMDNEYNQKSTDSLLNFETVKYFNAEGHESVRYKNALLDYKKANIKVSRSLVVLNVSQQCVIAAGLILNLLLAHESIQSNELRLGDFVLVNSYILQIYTPLNFLGTFWRMIRQSITDVEQVFELLEVDESIKEAVNPITPVFTDGRIVFRNVIFSYDKNIAELEQKKMILKGVSFEVEPGQSVAIVGPTGSGKSTIMRLLYRFYDVDGGEIFVDGQNTMAMGIKDLRSVIAIVPQDCVLFNDTLQYNIAYGGVGDDPGIIKEIDVIKEASRKAQVLPFVESQRDGFNTKVGERGLRLSGGEKQRVAIARALLKKNAKIMCFDEATSALDTNTEREIQGAIHEASKDKTTLIIAHRLSTIVNCDKIIVLKDGEIKETGTHLNLLEIDGIYKKLWQQQTDEQKKLEKKLKKESEKHLNQY